MEAARQPSVPQRAGRDMTFDIVKGVSIAEVMLHHFLSQAAEKTTRQTSSLWWVLTLGNRVLHFAVPTFLLISALLLARSLAAQPRPDWKRFYQRRLERTLWPYLVWTLFYLAFRLQVLRIGRDIAPTRVTLPWGEQTLPALLADPTVWARNVLWGKGYYHLYFLSILLQMALIFPFCFYSLRRIGPHFGSILIVSILLQGGAYELYGGFLKPVLGFTTPASSVLWYLPPLWIGAWIGLNWARWPSVWQAWRGYLLGITCVGFLLYMTLAVRQLQGFSIRSIGFNAGNLAYSTGMALLLLTWASRERPVTPLQAFLARLGERSLPLFLVHPLVLYYLRGPTLTVFLGRLPLPVVWMGILFFGASWFLVALIWRPPLKRLLFGVSSLSAR